MYEAAFVGSKQCSRIVPRNTRQTNVDNPFAYMRKHKRAAIA